MATDPNLEAGIAAVQAGDLSTAQQRLALVVRASPESVDAWWWLAQAMTDPARRKFCLERVLALDPTHAGARRLLAPATPKPAAPTPSARPPEPPSELADLPRLTPAHPPPPPPPPPPIDYIGALRAQAASQQFAALDEPEQEPAPTQAQPAPKKKPARRARRGLSNLQLAALVSGLTITLFGCLIAVSLAFNPVLRNMVFGPAIPALVASLTPTVITFPTLPPEWTATPTLDPLRATPTPAPTRTPHVTEVEVAQPADLNEAVSGLQSEIEQANGHLQNRRYADALDDWNEILAAAPDYAYGHDQRGEAYLGWGDERATYAENAAAALADFDTAIALDPSVGEYWLHRYDALKWFADVSFQRSDRDYWNRLALESIRQANELGNSAASGPRLPGLVLAELGECAEARAEFSALLNAGPDDTGGVHRGLALSDACQNNYASALANINAALAVTNYENWQLEKVAILYQLRRYTDALTAVNALIAANPHSCDCRLYLRALVRYALGDTAGAEEDLELAQRTGRASDGLREYLLGRMAQAAGDNASAISYYQDAETTLKSVYTGLRKEILDRLTALGAGPLEGSGLELPTATPIAVQAVPQPSPPAPNLARRPDGYIGEVIGQGGTGPFTLKAGQSRDFQFQSVPPEAGQRLGFNIYVLGPEGVEDSAASGLELHGWNQAQDTWADFTLLWGGQQVTDALPLISNTYDIYTTLTNVTGHSVEVVNIQIYIDDPDPP